MKDVKVDASNRSSSMSAKGKTTFQKEFPALDEESRAYLAQLLAELN
jgi:hypothetical protein